MAISIGANTVWRFFRQGVPAVGYFLRFYNNINQGQTQPAYRDSGGTQPITEIRLDNNGEPENTPQLYFDDTLSYFIVVENEDRTDRIYTLVNYTPIGGGGSGTTQNFYTDINHISNPQFFFFENNPITPQKDVEVKVAPPEWFFKQSSTGANAEATISIQRPDATNEIIGEALNGTATNYLRYNKTGDGVGETTKELYFRVPTARAFASRAGHPVNIFLQMDVKGSEAYTADLFYRQADGNGTTVKVVMGTINVTTDWETQFANATTANLTGLALTLNLPNDYVEFGVDINGLNSISSGTFDVVNVQLTEGDVNLAYVYSSPHYDNAMSLPIPARPNVGDGLVSSDSGKKITVDNDGNFTLGDASSVAGGESSLIWGGDFDTNPFQDGALTGISADATYVTDGYKVMTENGGAVYDASRGADAPTAAQARFNTESSLELEFTTAFSAGANTRYGLRHIIEAVDMKDLDGKSSVLSFWLKARYTAGTDLTFYIMLASEDPLTSATARVFVVERTIAAADLDTWQQFTVEIPSIDFGTGNWNAASQSTQNDAGLYVDVILSAGSNFANAGLATGEWVTTPAAGTLVPTANANTFAITDRFNFALIQMHEGSNLPEFPQQSPEQVLRKAERYYQKSYIQGVPPGTNSDLNYYTGRILRADSSGGEIFPDVRFKRPMKEDLTDTNITFYDISGNPNVFNDMGEFDTSAPAFPGSGNRPTAASITRTLSDVTNLGFGRFNYSFVTGPVTNINGPTVIFQWVADIRF